MLFAAKPKGFFVELSDNSLLIARARPEDGRVVIEELHECDPADEAAWAAVIARYLPKKKAAGYLHATCGVYPARRVVRRATLETKRLKEPAYLNEVAAGQLRIEPEKYSLSVLNARDGLDYDFAKAAVKDVVICGLPADDVVALQDQLLARRVYPERLELGSVATLGALTDYLQFAEIKTPVLALELGVDGTQSYIVSADGIEASRPIPQGFAAMVPVVQKELGLKDEESARRLFFSNTFDFTGMGPTLLKRLVRELQSSMGFHEVQTGQSIAHVVCVHLPPKLEWLEGSIAGQLGVAPLKLDLNPWLQARGISVADTVATPPWPARWLGLFSLMANQHVVVPEKET